MCLPPHNYVQSCVLYISETCKQVNNAGQDILYPLHPRLAPVIYLMSLVVQLFFPSVSLKFFLIFFCDLEQSAVQLFKELSNPALDLSRAWRRNRIVVLTLMTVVPPAVAEPPVGQRQERAAGPVGVERRGEGGDRQGSRDGHRLTEIESVCVCVSVCLMLLVSCGITQGAARRRNS